MSGNVHLGPFTFVLTCPACPEQYDMYADGVVVGYVRLRSGALRAHTQTDTTDLDSIDWASPFYVDDHWARDGDRLTGCFDDDEQRLAALRAIVDGFMAGAPRT